MYVSAKIKIETVRAKSKSFW
uniref:Uncharacterized protein n=1 Tax=Arundo donax TaxID=35708 RepID=A0A0A9A468_ARUDO